MMRVGVHGAAIANAKAMLPAALALLDAQETRRSNWQGRCPLHRWGYMTHDGCGKCRIWLLGWVIAGSNN
jgi:hypothetical protein